MDPDATRETLDHSLAYIFAVALEDGRFDHEASYRSERSHRPSTIELWGKIKTVEDDSWTRRYLDPDPDKKAFGGSVTIMLRDGTTLSDEIDVANAHPRSLPFTRQDYIDKFHRLASPVIDADEQSRFLETAEALLELTRRSLVA